MPPVKKYLSRTAWLLIVPSAAFFCMGIALLVASMLGSGWRFSLFEALAVAVCLLSIAGVLCGIGLLRRINSARLSAIGLLSAASLFWGMSVVEFALLAATEPQRFVAEARDEPAMAAVVVLLPLAVALWCIHTIYMLHKPDVRSEFDA